jgi:ESCRT-II complex subunit VPS22
MIFTCNVLYKKEKNSFFQYYFSRMRKRGIAGIKDRNKIKEKTAEKAQELQKADLEHVEKQFSLFKERLEHFAKNHRSEIRKNPAFRKQFQVFS